MARKGWAQLRPDYRERLEKAGITRQDYESGESLSKARGHKDTPEHPRQYDPQQYPQYHAERQRLERDLDRRKQQLFGQSPRWNARRSMENIREKPPSLALIRWALNAEDSELYDAIREDPETFYFLGYH